MTMTTPWPMLTFPPSSERTPMLGAGGARIALHTERFSFLLSCEGAFYGILDRFVLENFSWGQVPRPPTLHGIAVRTIY